MPLSSQAGQNRFMQGDPQGMPEPARQPPQGLMPQQSMMPPQGAPGAAIQGPGGAPQGPPPNPQQIEAARTHLQEIYNGLKPLTEMPNLTKKDVFSAVSDMIAKGAFPTQGSKQELIGEMATLPDDDRGIRKAIGAQLMRVSTGLLKLQTAHGGAPEPMAGGVPNAS